MAILCDMHGNFHVAIYERLFTWMFICCCCNLMMFYDWSEYVMSALGTTKHSSCDCIDTWQSSCMLAPPPSTSPPPPSPPIYILVSYLPAALRVQEQCESRGGRPGLPVPNSPLGLCGRKATPDLN